MSDVTTRPPRDTIRATPPAIGLRAADGEDDARPILFGHFARFNEWTEINSFFEGHFLERIAPGAFRKTFRERRDQIRVLLQHGRDPELRDRPIAEPEELREDDDGAYHESRLFDGVPELVMEGLRAGQYGQSFRMEILREEFVEEPGTSDDNPAALPERTIKEIRLFEYGPVTFPAYANTTPGVRSLTDEFLFEWLTREPERARELIGAVDLSRAALHEAANSQHPAPPKDDAGAQPHLDHGRRDSALSLYGLNAQEDKPLWRLSTREQPSRSTRLG